MRRSQGGWIQKQQVFNKKCPPCRGVLLHGGLLAATEETYAIKHEKQTKWRVSPSLGTVRQVDCPYRKAVF